MQVEITSQRLNPAADKGRPATGDILAVAGVPAFFVTTFCLFMTLTSQGRDIARILSDPADLNTSLRHIIWLVSASLVWAIATWNWTRIRFDALIPRPKTSMKVSNQDRFDPFRGLDWFIMRVFPSALAAIPTLVFAALIAFVGPSESSKWIVSIGFAFVGLSLFAALILRRTWIETAWIGPVILSVLTLFVFYWPLVTLLPDALSKNYMALIAFGLLLVLPTLVFVFRRHRDQFAEWTTVLSDEDQREEAKGYPIVAWLVRFFGIRFSNAIFLIFQFVVLNLIATALFAGLPVATGTLVGPGATVAFAFAAMLPVFSALAAFARPTSISLFGLLIALLLTSALVRSFIIPTERYEIRQLNDPITQIIAQTANGRAMMDRFALLPKPAQASERNQNDAAVAIDIAKPPTDWTTRWLSHPRPARSSPTPIIFISSSGGGQKAALWTGLLLTIIQDERDRKIIKACEQTADQSTPSESPNGLRSCLTNAGRFNDYVFAISSVSGGTWGATTYNALLTTNSDREAGDYASIAESILGADALSPILSALFFSDLVSYFMPLPLLPNDRAAALEKAFEQAWRKRKLASSTSDTNQEAPSYIAFEDDCGLKTMFENNFLCLWDQGAPVWRPALLINGTHRQTGERIVTSNIILAGQFGNLIDFFDLVKRDIRTSTAITNAARFPLASPPGLITDRDRTAYGQILDGGYVDNFGSVTLLDVSQRVVSHLSSLASENELYQPIFIEIANDRTVPCRGDGCLMVDKPDPPIKAAPETPPRIGLFEEFAAPIGGIINAKTKDADAPPLALAEYASTLSANGRISGKGAYYQFRLCDVEGFDTPLGWVHSKSGLEIYHRSVPQQNRISTDAPSNTSKTAECLCANHKAMHELMCALNDIANCPSLPALTFETPEDDSRPATLACGGAVSAE